MNLRDRIPLHDADRAPHRGSEQDGCLPLLMALSPLIIATIIVIAITWK